MPVNFKRLRDAIIIEVAGAVDRFAAGRIYDAVNAAIRSALPATPGVRPLHPNPSRLSSAGRIAGLSPGGCRADTPANQPGDNTAPWLGMADRARSRHACGAILNHEAQSADLACASGVSSPAVSGQR